MCNSTGSCVECDGLGDVVCEACGGKAEGCDLCGGTGRCVCRPCDGSGVCPRCRGTGEVAAAGAA